MSAKTKLNQVIFCQEDAKRFSGEPLRERLSLPDRLEASRPIDEAELSGTFFSQYLRPGDVPLAFHRESPSSHSVLRMHADALAKMAAYGRMIQYVFSDGSVLAAHQVLYHAHSKLVPRHLLPLNVNVKAPLQGASPYTLMSMPVKASGIPMHRASWQLQAEQVLISVLLSAARAAFLHHALAHEEEEPLELYFTLASDPREPRAALKLCALELGNDTWGPWRLTTELAPPHSGVHHGRARLEIDPGRVGNLQGLAEGFWLDTDERKLVFHTFREQIKRLESKLGAPEPTEKPHELEVKDSRPGLEAGIAVHFAGHSVIQATLGEVNEIISSEGRLLEIHPASHFVEKANIQPQVFATGDGSFRLITKFEIAGVAGGSPRAMEAHGLPRSMAYLLLALQLGLGATTGLAVTQIAHSRKGIKRDRDIKILRHLGIAQLIFFEAASFALGQPLSDGTVVRSEEELFASIFDRLGSLVLKSEGWPVQVGSLETLCSPNVISLIKGFARQVILDAEGRAICLYLPEGEFKLDGLTRPVLELFHSFVSDLAAATSGACFTRARTKYFDEFLCGRPTPEREDLAVREAMTPEASARAIYQPGINERYLLPESSVPPRGTSFLSLITKGFELAIDGKFVEEFEATDFRPEFTLREELEAVPLGTGKIDWFELHPKFFFKGIEINADQAARLSKDGMIEFQGRLYRVNNKDMPSLKRLTQFWSSIQTHNAGLLRTKRRRTEDTYLQLPRSQTLELLALRASGVKMSGGPRWERITRFYDSLDTERGPVALPESFHARLQPYQEKAVRWLEDLHELGLGAILADDMGLGKTVTSLAFLETLRTRDALGPTLILVPTSLTYNWLSEAERFTPELPVTIFGSRASEQMLDFVRARNTGAVICTYGLLQENAELFQQVPWHIVIFDEAQNLKNITTKRTTAARQLEAGFKLCLTGTPLENHYGEFYSLFDLIVPGSLGDLPSFREKFVNPPRVLIEDIEFLKLKARPLMLRRTKSQVMHELPPKIETTIKLPFEEGQKRIYRDIASSYNEQVRSAIATHGEAKSQLQMLTALLRLRQACSDPAAIPGVKYDGEPPKVSTLVEALTEITGGGASALVFTQFLATFERIRASLAAAKIPFYDINGSDSRLNREKKLRAFEESPEGAVMLMTLKTGGVGLNLTKASYVFHIEPWWNPAVENQATDRAHRMGQSKTVQVYRYLIRDSVEEKIEILKDIKTKRFDALFSVSESETELGPGGAALTQRDFEYLLS